MNMDKYYESVLNRYERGEEKVSLKERGFKYSYGDKIEKQKISPDFEKLGKYFNNLSYKEQKEILRKMNEVEDGTE